MPITDLHPDYLANLPDWQSSRDVFAGEKAVKAGGEKYIPRLPVHSDSEYRDYVKRASFFNATARTSESFIGLIFRRPPLITLPAPTTPEGHALRIFENDTDLLGTSLQAYAKNIVAEVIGLGRAGTLVDWNGGSESRAMAVFYSAERILNWRMGRVNGRPVPRLIVLQEWAAQESDDEFSHSTIDQLRVLRLEPIPHDNPHLPVEMRYVIEVWQHLRKSKSDKYEWVLVETRIPTRMGRPLPLIPFVFHGPRHSQPAVDKIPLEDVINVNLDHFRLDAEFKHALHFTALPTPWTTGFPESAQLRIGSTTAWTTENPNARVGFLEFTGQGLTTLERALDRDERLLSVLGSRLLEPQKRVGETAAAIELRQSNENSILANLALSVSQSLTQMLRWVHWWNSIEPLPDAIDDTKVYLELNTDFSVKGLDSSEITSLVSAWQNGAISRETMLDLFRKGEVLSEGRTNAEEQTLIAAESGASPESKPVTKSTHR